MNTILLVDDETAILQMLSDYLKANYQIKRAINGRTALNFLKQESPDLIITDWMMPDMSGLELVSWVRGNELYKDIPIIMLTAKGEEQDKLEGFSAGVDDYLAKPFSLSELGARIKALLKRSSRSVDNSISYQDLRLDLANKSLYIQQDLVKLTSKEYKLLKLLIKHPERIYSRDQIIALVWGSDSVVSDRAVDVLISRARKILQDKSCPLLQTVRGLGYRLAIDES